MKNGLRCLLFIVMLFLFLNPVSSVLIAQDEGEVQIEYGVIRSGEFFWYLLPELEAGKTLYINLHNTSGNLDPIMGLVGEGVTTGAVQEQYQGAIQQAVVDGRDPLMAAQKVADEIFLVWDDDGGEGLAAQFSFVIPDDGDYKLIVTDAFTIFGQATSGDFELLIGIDEPQVLSGAAEATGASIAILDKAASSSGVAVEEIQGTISEGEEVDVIDLHEIHPGDTISLFVEATSGDLKPALVLLNYADKPVSATNMNGQEKRASLDYTVEDNGRGFAVQIYGCCDEEGSSGDYRLLVGINAPEVLTGEAVHSEEGIIMEPTPVAIGIKVQQIIEVDEQNEFFNAAASLQMEWDDPNLAFSPDECDCTFKIYTNQNFDEFIADIDGRWPDFTVFNQQGNRWTQNRVVAVGQDGHAMYFERFTTNFQVDFDFRQYPFDSEEFVIQIDSIYPDTFYYFTDLEGYSEISADHGEDEFMIGEFRTVVSSENASTKSTTSRFTMSFGGPRHANYYIIQVFVPILLIQQQAGQLFRRYLGIEGKTMVDLAKLVQPLEIL